MRLSEGPDHIIKDRVLLLLPTSGQLKFSDGDYFSNRVATKWCPRTFLPWNTKFPAPEMRHARALVRALVLALCVGQGAALKVFVSGAGGQTGQSVFRKMLARPEFSPVGVVRSEESKAALVESGVPAECVVVCDVTDADAVMRAMAGCEAVVIATSAKPAPTGETKEDGRPVFGFPNGQPEAVDWLGQKSQIDAAIAQGPGTHVVICSSMGGTDPNHMLNSLGRETRS